MKSLTDVETISEKCLEMHRRLICYECDGDIVRL